MLFKRKCNHETGWCWLGFNRLGGMPLKKCIKCWEILTPNQDEFRLMTSMIPLLREMEEKILTLYGKIQYCKYCGKYADPLPEKYRYGA